MVTLTVYETVVECSVPKVVSGRAELKPETFTLKGKKDKGYAMREVLKRYGDGVVDTITVLAKKYGMERNDFLEKSELLVETEAVTKCH